MIKFGPEAARHIDRFGSNFEMSKLIRTEKLHVGCMYFPPGGSVGRHPAMGNQLFVVVAGSGWVRGGEGDRVAVSVGDAVQWADGEEHEQGTDEGMTAIVIEFDD